MVGLKVRTWENVTGQRREVTTLADSTKTAPEGFTQVGELLQSDQACRITIDPKTGAVSMSCPPGLLEKAADAVHAHGVAQGHAEAAQGKPAPLVNFSNNNGD